MYDGCHTMAPENFANTINVPYIGAIKVTPTDALLAAG
jgi:hypothetical protein